MRFALPLALAALSAASPAAAGGIPGITLPHLTWPQDTAPETPTRNCPEPLTLGDQRPATCPSENG